MRYWLDRAPLSYVNRKGSEPGEPCPFVQDVPRGPYAYLLGLYLGDGCLSRTRRDVYRLGITLDAKYPGIIAESRAAMRMVLPNKVGQIVRTGCIEVYSHSKHWVCLFPQHGAGPKHLRPIVLDGWQADIALTAYPHLFLRGLIQSDGWRGVNRIGGRYEYPRYLFSNRSADIRQLFQAACGRMEIACRPNGKWQVSVARKRDVGRMDVFVGEKR